MNLIQVCLLLISRLIIRKGSVPKSGISVSVSHWVKIVFLQTWIQTLQAEVRKQSPQKSLAWASKKQNGLGRGGFIWNCFANLVDD